MTSRAAEFLAAFVPLMTLAGIAVVLEFILPWRKDRRADGLHWMQSVVLMTTGNLLARLVLPLSIFSAGAFAAAEGWGLFNHVAAPWWVVWPVAIMALDLTDYARHRTFHVSDFAWRAHRVHHSDEEITTSTALRFHPFEALLTAALHVVTVLIFGIPATVAVSFAMIVLVFDIWEHANVRTPRWVRRLEWLIITPETHRLHHGAGEEHVNSNFGTIFSIWDRMFGTYRGSAALRDDIRFGLGPSSTLKFDTLGALLGDPARRG